MQYIVVSYILSVSLMKIKRTFEPVQISQLIFQDENNRRMQYLNK